MPKSATKKKAEAPKKEPEAVDAKAPEVSGPAASTEATTKNPGDAV